VLTSATCDDGSDPSAIGLDADETVTCTFTNTKLGSITIVKDAVPDDEQDFSFTGDLDDFDLDDDADGTLPNSMAFSDLPSGSYDVTEVSIHGDWDLTDIDCDDDNSTGDLVTATASIELEPGEEVTCTFKNTREDFPTVEVDKTVDGSDPDGEFSDDETTSVDSTVTYKVVIDNDSAESVTITSLLDDTYAGIVCRDANGDDVIGQILAKDDGDGPGSMNGGDDEITCAFKAQAPSTTETVVTDVITVEVVDEQENTASDDDDATIRTLPQEILGPTPTPTPAVLALPPTGSAPGGSSLSGLSLLLGLCGLALLTGTGALAAVAVRRRR